MYLTLQTIPHKPSLEGGNGVSNNNYLHIFVAMPYTDYIFIVKHEDFIFEAKKKVWIKKL